MGQAYFMVHRRDGANPAVQHDTYAAAWNEARRLAALHPGERFVILGSLQELFTDSVCAEDCRPGMMLGSPLPATPLDAPAAAR